MKKNILTTGLLLVAIAATLALKKQHAHAPLTPETLNEMQSIPRLLDLGATKCVPCKMMAPILDEMAETFEGQLDVQFIDVWENEEAGKKYGIRMIPTQLFFDAEGNELFRHEGFFSREDLLAKWSELGHTFTEAE